RDVDLANLRALAFLDVDADLDLVAGDFVDLGVDAHGVLAARVVLIGERALDVVEHGLIERLARGEADVAERFLELLGLDVLVALDLEALDRRPLEHGDDERRAFAAHLDVAEEAGREELLQRLGGFALIEPVANVHGQVVVYRAFGNTLQPFDANVA